MVARVACARLPALLTASLVAFGVSGCSTDQTTDRDTADAWGAVDVDPSGAIGFKWTRQTCGMPLPPQPITRTPMRRRFRPTWRRRSTTDRYRASAGFTSTQGANGWYYRQFDGVSYSDMTYDAAANRWQGNDPFCLIGPSWMHADLHQAVRVWKAPYEGRSRSKGRWSARPSMAMERECGSRRTASRSGPPTTGKSFRRAS